MEDAETIVWDTDSDVTDDDELFTHIEDFISSDFKKLLQEDESYWRDIPIEQIINHPFAPFPERHSETISVF
tara:strand:+ start:296 stop:511 length:216 start_codon:yes stop_codon:yes gene_type:complete